MQVATKRFTRSDYLRAVIAQIPFFESLSEAERAQIVDCARCVSYRRDQYVFRAGDTAEVGAFLVQGLVALTTAGAHDRPLGIEVIAAPEPFGVLAVINQIPYPLSALVLEPAVTMEVPADIIRTIVERSAQLKSSLLAIAASRFCEAQHVIQSLAGSSARARIAYALLLLLKRLKAPRSGPPLLPVTRKQLACLGGTTVETAIRTMKQFEQEGIVRMPKLRCVEIVRPDSLERIAA